MAMDTHEKCLSTLIDIADAIRRNPTPEDLCQILATKVSPCDELARVYCGRIDRDGNIRTVASFGYSLEANVMNVVTPLNFDRPMPDAVRNHKVIVENKEEILAKYRNYEPLDLRSPWVSTAVVPTLGRLVFVFRLQCRVDQSGIYKKYFTMIGALLDFYLYDETESLSKKITNNPTSDPEESNSTRSLLGKPLTERQDWILERIKEKQTNIQIAQALGYSESLIRHETIIIYSKLGISGRRELLREENKSENKQLIKVV